MEHVESAPTKQRRPYRPPGCTSVVARGSPVLLACTGFAVNCEPEGFPGCCLSEGETCDAVTCF